MYMSVHSNNIYLCQKVPEAPGRASLADSRPVQVASEGRPSRVRPTVSQEGSSVSCISIHGSSVNELPYVQPIGPLPLVHPQQRGTGRTMSIMGKWPMACRKKGDSSCSKCLNMDRTQPRMWVVSGNCGAKVGILDWPAQRADLHAVTCVWDFCPILADGLFW